MVLAVPQPCDGDPMHWFAEWIFRPCKPHSLFSYGCDDVPCGTQFIFVFNGHKTTIPEYSVLKIHPITFQILITRSRGHVDVNQIKMNVVTKHKLLVTSNVMRLGANSSNGMNGKLIALLNWGECITNRTWSRATIPVVHTCTHYLIPSHPNFPLVNDSPTP